MRIIAYAAVVFALWTVPLSSRAECCHPERSRGTRDAPVLPEDLFKLTLLSNASISPDGTHVLVEASRMNGPKDNYDRTIELVDVSSGRLTHDVTKHAGDGDFAWMPDGRSFVFVRTVAKQKPQLYQYTMATRRVVQLTHISQGVSSPVPSHAGDRIALTVTDTDPAPNAQIDFSKAGFSPKASQKKSDIRIIDRLFFETNGQGYTYRDHAHIWTIEANGAHPKQLTFGQWAEGFDAWSPDDRTILFDSLRYESVDSGTSDVYTIPSSLDSARDDKIHKIPSPLPANNGLFFSTDGSRVYMVSAAIGTWAPELPELVSVKPDGTDRRVIVARNTVSFGDSLLADMKEGGGFCGWPLPDGKRMVSNVDGLGYANLRTLDLSNGAVSDVTPPKGEAWSCTVSRDGSRIAYLYSDFTHPADLYLTGLGAAPKQLTDVNAAYLASVTLSQAQEFTVKDSAGFTVQAWFMPATTGSPGAKHPTLLDIHGGPETQFGDSFFHEFQVYTSAGYNVVFCDPAGSTGHGFAFTEALEHDYGDAMFRDVQAVMDAAVQRPGVDASRLGVLGGSYGGYATLWVISHTDRYKVAVAERAVSDLQTENLGADFAGKNGLGGGYYTWGPPWDPASTDYVKFSPLTYVAGVHTPVMILHSDEDTRAPVDQTLIEYSSLKILGRTVQYVAVPGENHDLSRTGSPIHRVERLHLILDWLQRYI